MRLDNVSLHRLALIVTPIFIMLLLHARLAAYDIIETLSGDNFPRAVLSSTRKPACLDEHRTRLLTSSSSARLATNQPLFRSRCNLRDWSTSGRSRAALRVQH